MQRFKIWDLPTRLFHWLLAAGFAFMWFSAETGGNWLAWHIRIGSLLFGLLVFRICWGIWGSDTARFRQFVRPGRIAAYLRGQVGESEQPGHNPLGAMMVLALLAALAVQLVSGLFAADENTFIHNGYLNGLVSEAAGSAMRSLHMAFFNVLLTLVAVHIAAVAVYRLVKKQNLVTPMISGYKFLHAAPKLRFAGAGAFLAAAAVAVAAVYALYQV
ncbi:cytochrome b/b6 domain-containing protein [Neisseria leonii]|uniref:cytochrome b/b6 domain-containing protein n=1 Tax=Neisseria leonii TaxID=2995413 RepID=UPI0030CF3A96